MTHSPFQRSLIIGLVALGAMVASQKAEAAWTLQASAGTSLLLVSDDDISANRGPVMFDIGPGWDFKMLRIEVPLVFAIDEPKAYPRARQTFLGIRPQAKLFPFDWIYGKLSAPVLFPGGEGDEADIVLGLSLGAGVEFGVADVILVHAELNVSPYVTPDTAVPLEGRIGATLRF